MLWADCRQAVELKPDWPKGYTRVGAAAFHLRDWPAATKAYEKGAPPEPAHALRYQLTLMTLPMLPAHSLYQVHPCSPSSYKSQ